MSSNLQYLRDLVLSQARRVTTDPESCGSVTQPHPRGYQLLTAKLHFWPASRCAHGIRLNGPWLVYQIVEEGSGYTLKSEYGHLAPFDIPNIRQIKKPVSFERIQKHIQAWGDQLVAAFPEGV